MSRRRPIVAIDGPAGAGKSTVSRAVAARLGYLYIDTGAMYRAAALAAQRAGLELDDEAAVAGLCASLVVGFGPPPAGSGGVAPVLLGDEDVSALIRSEEISMLASRFSAKPALRARLTEIQRALGAAGGVVMEGRDIGTVVFPDAEAKFFLTASEGERARRRHAELTAKGEAVSAAGVQAEMARRDRQDASRQQAPLRRAADAEAIDSTAMGVEQVVERIVARAKALERG